MKFSKAAAAIYGTAVGDALGVPFQFRIVMIERIILLQTWKVMEPIV